MDRLRLVNNEVDGGPAFKIPAHLSYGQYIIDKFRDIVKEGGDIALVSLIWKCVNFTLLLLLETSYVCSVLFE